MRALLNTVLLTALTVALLAAARAQESSVPPSAPEGSAEKSTRSAGDAPASIRFGLPAIPRWNLAAIGSVLQIFDSNPTSSTVPVYDYGQRFTGFFSLSHLGAKVSYRLNYAPSFTYYQHTEQMRSLSHNLDQSLSYRFSAFNSIEWTAAAQRYPSWAGASYSDAAIGSLLSAQTGSTERSSDYDLIDIQSALRIKHAINRHSSISLVASGGVTRYQRTYTDPLLGLSASTDSRTWTGKTSLEYQRTLTVSSSLEVRAGHQYFLFTPGHTHQNVESADATFTRHFQNHWYLSAGLGPSFLEKPGRAGVTPGVVLRAGAGWSSSRSLLRLSADRNYQAGLAPGTTTSWSGHASYEHLISRRLSGGIYAVYQRSPNAAAVLPGLIVTTEAYNASVQVDYRLQRWLRWLCSYSYSVRHGYWGLDHPVSRHQFATGFNVQFTQLGR